MASTFFFDEKNDLIIREEALKLCTVLSKIKKKNVLYIILVYDPIDSPYRKKPFEERKKMAIRRLFDDDGHDPEEDDLVALAVDEYKSITYSYWHELRDLLMSKLTLLNAQLYGATNSTEVKNIMASTTLIETKLHQIEDRIEKEEEELKLKGGKKISLVEKFMANRDMYRQKMAAIMKQNQRNV